MTLQYQAVGWNPQKKRYDRALLLGVLGYLALFVGVGAVLHPAATAETHIIRGFGTASFLLLHVILVIGPLCRLDRRFLPLLYNRRHLGVCMFALALIHGGLSTLQFHGFGDVNPFVSIFTANPRYDSLTHFPFQPLGFVALGILFLMAATSHDFWLTNLTAPVWKALHMLVYVAYALLVMHVTLGALQSETSPVLPALVGLGMVSVLGLHLASAAKEKAGDRRADREASDWVDVCAVDDIPEARAHTVTLAGDRVAVFRYDGKLSAVSAACQHQNGPLGEGRVIDGTITCPWHGYQYRPDCGRSPEPFTEKIPTFAVQVRDGRVLVDPRPLPAGTAVEPASIDGPGDSPDDGDFYVGYLPEAPAALGARTRRVTLGLMVVTWALGLTIVSVLRPVPLANFEFGVVRSFTGRISEQPVPTLEVDRPGTTAGPPSRFLLVSGFKWGAGAEIAGLDGRRVTLQGSLVYRDDRTMIELAPGGLRLLEDQASPADQHRPPVILGEHTLRGEIVDSKCFLGVMNPGNLKVHRACAARCISGGIPPVLAVRNESGVASYLVLVGADGRMVNDEILAMIAEPLEISGTVERHDDLLILRAEPDTYRRLPDGQSQTNP